MSLERITVVPAHEVNIADGPDLDPGEEGPHGEILIPIDLYLKMGRPEKLELRVLKDEKGEPQTLVLSRLEAE